MPATVPAVQTTEVAGRTVAYREAGSGPAVLLVHGWPTSSFLWRGIMPAIARRNRVIAIDLPGFGASDKPAGVRYDADLFEPAIDGLLDHLGVDAVGLAVHDLGGPVGVHWALGNRDRLSALALLNTLVYPELSDAVAQFIALCTGEESRAQLTSPAGLEAAMRFGVTDGDALGGDVIAAVQAPFEAIADREALARAGIEFPVAGFQEIAARLPELTVPVRIIYGEQDRILPDVAETMARVAADLPQAVTTALPGCGHFLQEEEPEQIGEFLAEFFAESAG